jgi:hypothetical protein
MGGYQLHQHIQFARDIVELDEAFGLGAPFAQVAFSKENEIVLEPTLKRPSAYVARARFRAPRTQDDGKLGLLSAQSADDSSARAKLRKALTKHYKFRKGWRNGASRWRRILRVQR